MKREIRYVTQKTLRWINKSELVFLLSRIFVIAVICKEVLFIEKSKSDFENDITNSLYPKALEVI